MKKINILLLVLCIIGFIYNSTSFAGPAGTTGAQFLKIAPGARAAAMGGAYVAIAKDANALYWNPAGLTRIENIDFTAMYGMWFQGVTYQFVGLAKNFGSSGALGISAIMLNSGDIEGYDDIGTSQPGYTMSDSMMAVSYGKCFGNINLGVSFKSIQEEIATEKASCTGLDIGIFMDLENISLGLSVQNAIFTELEYYSISHELPMIIRMGMGYKLSEKMLFALETDLPGETDMNIRAGFEYVYNETIALRAGYKTTTNTADTLGLSAGLGLLFGNFGVEYAFVPYGDLGDTHRISLSSKF